MRHLKHSLGAMQIFDVVMLCLPTILGYAFIFSAAMDCFLPRGTGLTHQSAAAQGAIVGATLGASLCWARQFRRSRPDNAEDFESHSDKL